MSGGVRSYVERVIETIKQVKGIRRLLPQQALPAEHGHRVAPRIYGVLQLREDTHDSGQEANPSL